MNKYHCADCGISSQIKEGPLLLDNIWLSIAKKKECLCYECIEKRLDRQIQIQDLRLCPMNSKFIKKLEQ